MLKAILLTAPVLANFAASIYGQPVELLVWGAVAGSLHIQSHTGVRQGGQGDPCGPLYFRLSLQGPLEQVQQMHPNVRLITYAEDTYLQDSQQDVVAAFATMIATTFLVYTSRASFRYSVDLKIAKFCHCRKIASASYSTINTVVNLRAVVYLKIHLPRWICARMLRCTSDLDVSVISAEEWGIT